MQRVTVGVAVDGNRADAAGVKGAHDAAGDLTTIRDENCPEHHGGLTS